MVYINSDGVELEQKMNAMNVRSGAMNDRCLLGLRLWAASVSSALAKSARLVLLLAGAALAGCATSSNIVDHGFGFNARADSPEIEILDFQYGTSRNPGTRNAEVLKLEGKAPQSSGTSGPMEVGDTLYVKWKIRSTGETLEETVDLASRLPADLFGKQIYFMVEHRRLHVYVVTRNKKRPDGQLATDGPKLYRDLDTLQIYPTPGSVRSTR